MTTCFRCVRHAALAVAIAVSAAATASAGPISEEWFQTVPDLLGQFQFGQVMMELDASGNVYIAAFGNHTAQPEARNYLTVKYDADGVWQWSQEFNGTSDLDDDPFGLAVDASGNVYVTGSSQDTDEHDGYLTVKYDTAGIEQWAVRYDGDNDYPGCSTADIGRDVAVDAAGNVYVTGSAYLYESSWMGCHQDVVTIKYSPSGVEQWVRRVNGALYNSSDSGQFIAVTPGGDVYVLGYLGSGFGDMVTIKYDTNGTEQWSHTYDGTGGITDSPAGIALDPAGNAYVLGTSDGVNPAKDDFVIIKYTAAGVEDWVERYDGAGHPTLANDEAKGIAVDASGNVFVTGSSYVSGNGADLVTIKYDTNGTEQWTELRNGDDDSSDWGDSIVPDGVGGAIVTGTTSDHFTHRSFITIHYDDAGNERWVATRRHLDDGAFAEDVRMGPDGKAVVTGVMCGSSGCDYATLKYGLVCDEVVAVTETEGGWSTEDMVWTPVAYGSGDDVMIEAGGTIHLIALDETVGPTGKPGEACGFGCAMPSENLGALIGTVGSEDDDGPYFLVGDAYSSTAAQAGDLWFVINEASYNGTTGSFEATITLSTDPSCGGCTTNAECDDGDPCNGEEVCGLDGQCQPGTPVVGCVFIDDFETGDTGGWSASTS
jgi:hypothetical protein